MAQSYCDDWWNYRNTTIRLWYKHGFQCIICFCLRDACNKSGHGYKPYLLRQKVRAFLDEVLHFLMQDSRLKNIAMTWSRIDNFKNEYGVCTGKYLPKANIFPRTNQTNEVDKESIKCLLGLFLIVIFS